MQITYSYVILPDLVTTYSMRYQGPNQNQALTFSGNDIRQYASKLGDLLIVTLEFNKLTGEETKLMLFPPIPDFFPCQRSSVPQQSSTKASDDCTIRQYQ